MEISDSLPPGITLLIVIASVALLLLLRRIAFPLLARVVKATWSVFARIFRAGGKPITRLLRFLRVIPKTSATAQTAVAVESVVGVSVGTLSHAFGSETDEAITRNFDTKLVPMQRNKQFFCTWLAPLLMEHPVYNKGKADDDLATAKAFFITEFPTGSNPLNLYDDIEAAFIVDLLKTTDAPCLYVLSEFKKTINANVIVLSVLYSFIVSIVAVLNIMASTTVPFHSLFGVSKYFPITLGKYFTDYSLAITSELFDKSVFGILSCLAGFALMWFFYHTEYGQFQRYNGQQMNNFLVDYLSRINIDFSRIHTKATEAILEERSVEEMKQDIALWVTNLQWTAFRAFFIEWYLRNILFQIRRNSSYYLFFIPLLFILAMAIAIYAFNLRQFNAFDLRADLYRQTTFYPFFAWLLFVYYGYLTRSVSFVWESIAGRRWSKFRELDIQTAMTRITDSFVVQLDRWRSMMKSRA